MSAATMRLVWFVVACDEAGLSLLMLELSCCSEGREADWEELLVVVVVAQG